MYQASFYCFVRLPEMEDSLQKKYSVLFADLGPFLQRGVDGKQDTVFFMQNLYET